MLAKILLHVVLSFNILISVLVIAISVLSETPKSPFIKGYSYGILMKIYGSLFFSLGYGVIPLSVGSLIVIALSLIRKNMKLRYVIPVLIISIAVSALGAYISYDTGGIIGESIRNLLEKINLPQNISIALITSTALILTFMFSVPALIRKTEENERTDEKIKEKTSPTEKTFPIGIKVKDETSHITDVLSIPGDKTEVIQEEEEEKIHETESKQEEEDEFKLPPPDLLDDPEEYEYDSPDALSKTARELIQALESFGIKGKIISATSGPVVNFFEFVPESGIRASKIVLLGDDIAIAMRMPGIRIVAPVPGSGAVGFEVPRKKRSIVRLKEVFFAQEAKKMKIPLTIGKDIYGRPFVIDLQKLPHLLIAGTTGSGKSVLLNTIILSLLMRFKPDELKFILVDPKMLEFSPYSGIPNLVTDVVTSPKGAIDVLCWAVDEMLKRYQTMKKASAKNIDNFVEKTGEKMYRIIIVIDEFADLMVSSARKVEEYVMRLSQMARAAGIHLILTTQRPSADVVTGIIKSNLPARIALRVSDKTNSRVILDTNGAETLLGQGDFLFSMSGIQPQRGHACFVSDNEIHRVVEYLKKQGEPDYIQIITDEDDGNLFSAELFENRDPKFREAVEIAKNYGQISISLLQRKLGIGFNRAARIVEEMEEEGIIQKQDKKLVFVGIPNKQKGENN